MFIHQRIADESDPSTNNKPTMCTVMKICKKLIAERNIEECSLG